MYFDMTGIYCFNLKGIYDMMAEMYCFGGGGCGGVGGGDNESICSGGNLLKC